LYSYTYDSTTGGILLNSSPTGFSKEPRPVYAPELDLLGFGKHWKYDKQPALPYMWAEANSYYYRGALVAKLKGGNIYTAPEIVIPNDANGSPITPEPDGISLRPIDIESMIKANREMLDIIEQATVRKILAVYAKHKDKLDCFHVAFSGGKDSLVLLDLVKKALPKGSFVVVFGDTGMEFPDTYEVVEKIKQQCVDEEISFYIAVSHLTPKESWTMFGPPSRVLRWCCSVHKSAPQALRLREVTGKNDFTGLSFVGVRAHESATRAEYEYENYGRKLRGHYSHNPILEWTSAEIWLYIYMQGLFLNEAYKKGSARVGCVFCPMGGGGKAGYVEFSNYPNEVNNFVEIIKESNGRSEANITEYVKNGGWGARKNGRDLANNPIRYTEINEAGQLVITIESPLSDWREWIKTIELSEEHYGVTETRTGYIVKLDESIVKKHPLMRKLFRQVFHKAASCSACGVCEANCTNRAIQFLDGKIEINDCTKCQKCHAIENGCILYQSLRHPQGGGKSMSLNTMSSHAPRTEWFSDFFERRNEFFTENTLGPNQVKVFERVLREAGLTDNNRITSFGEIVSTLRWDSDAAQGLILINLVSENAQFRWYVENMDINVAHSRNHTEEMLIASGISPTNKKGSKNEALGAICRAFERLVETPLGTRLNFGYVTDDDAYVRTKCSINDARVVLYGLFKFAEKCNDYKEFTLATLINDSIERDGISPTRIFGLDRVDMQPLLLGLSAKYPDFITASFTHDLEKITLAADKTSEDVLNLFKGDGVNG